jgi:hypothetical protein
VKKKSSKEAKPDEGKPPEFSRKPVGAEITGRLSLRRAGDIQDFWRSSENDESAIVTNRESHQQDESDGETAG